MRLVQNIATKERHANKRLRTKKTLTKRSNEKNSGIYHIDRGTGNRKKNKERRECTVVAKNKTE